MFNSLFDCSFWLVLNFADFEAVGVHVFVGAQKQFCLVAIDYFAEAAGKIAVDLLDGTYAFGAGYLQKIGVVIDFDAFEKQPESAGLRYFDAESDFFVVSVWVR